MLGVSECYFHRLKFGHWDCSKRLCRTLSVDVYRKICSLLFQIKPSNTSKTEFRNCFFLISFHLKYMLEEGLDGLSRMLGCCGTSSMEIKYSIMAVFGSAGGKCTQQAELSGENINITYKPDGTHIAVGNRVYFTIWH